jgi:hypothetical protein
MSQRGRPQATVTGPVLKALADMRYAKAPQIQERIGGSITLRQVERALYNAAQRKIVCSSGIERERGVRGGALHSTYWMACDTPPADVLVRKQEKEEAQLFKPNRRERKRKPMRFASVFHYAQGITATTEAA